MFAFQRLLSLIARGKSVPVMETTIEEPTDEEHKMYCVTCGWDIPVKSAIKHMELCFRKVPTKTLPHLHPIGYFNICIIITSK